jgi:hypothetical protein
VAASGASYYLNTTPTDNEAAAAACNENGGHLAAYSNAAEQLEVSLHLLNSLSVPLPLDWSRCGPLRACGLLQPLRLPLQVESHFIQRGYLLASFHKHYWLGIRAATWGAWKPLDQQLNSSYLNWHMGQPNGLSGPQLCTVANGSASGMVGPGGWGYADVLCSGTHSYMCRIAGRW